MPSIDALDLKILARYQRNTQTPAQTIGKAVGLSAAAVQRRLKRMREDGTLTEVAQVKPERVGFPTTCLVGVRLDREGKLENARFKQAMTKHACVQQCYSVTGDVDFMLVVLVRDMRDFEQFAEEALYADANVRSFTTFVCLDRVKVSMAVPL